MSGRPRLFDGRWALKLSAALTLLSSSVLSLSVLATTYPGLDWQQLVALSDVVVLVEVETTEVRDLGRGRLATFHHGRVVETLLGRLPPGAASSTKEGATVPTRAQVTFAYPGGLLGDRGQRVSGMPTLRPGRWVVFLGPPRGPGGARGVVGHALGTFRVVGEKLFSDEDAGGHPGVPRRLNRLREKLREPLPATPGGAPLSPASAPSVVRP